MFAGGMGRMLVRALPGSLRFLCISRLSHQGAGQTANLSFVPSHQVAGVEDVNLLQEFVEGAGQLLVITGAGLSTESGIPDYRSEGVGLYARSTRRPMLYQEFLASPAGRQRYWARNFVGWPAFSSVEPNAAHYTLTRWRLAGKVSRIVTQNVDALHHKAGCEDTLELHGCSHRVKCLGCGRISRRADLQEKFHELNPDWQIVEMPVAPDGDVLLEDKQVKGFQVPPCEDCGGNLIPDVVFFGDSVPRPLVEQVYDMVTSSDAVLVAGSSLQVYSGYRFVVHAASHNVPIAIVNIGPTRGDKLASLKIESPCGSILPQIDITTPS